MKETPSYTQQIASRMTDLLSRLCLHPIIEVRYLARKYLNPQRFQKMVSAHRSIVDRLFNEVIGKSPDPDSLIYYSAQLHRGLISVEQLRDRLWRSRGPQEYEMVLVPVMDEIKAVYSRVLFQE